MPPGRHVAIINCMDARVRPYGIFGLGEGDAHVIRNAGGAITDDAIRSLAISQRLLGTEEIIVVHHADCGMRAFTDEAFARQIQDDTGIRPPLGVPALPGLCPTRPLAGEGGNGSHGGKQPRWPRRRPARRGSRA